MIVQCLNRSNEYDNIEVKSVADYVPSHGFSLHKPLGKKKDSPYYIDQFGTFDIETTSRTRIEKDAHGEEVTKPIDAFMYVWSACIDGEEVHGRYWKDFIDLLDKIQNYYCTNESRYFVIYVHNLPFEFSFMIGYLNDYSEVFATGKRKPLVWRLKKRGIELRCSYKLTNMSLDNFTKKMAGCTHIKAKGDLDYSLIRHNESYISPTEWGYIINDTLGLWEAICYMLRKDGDTIATVPLTSTSYVRRDMKRAIRKGTTTRLLKKKLALTDVTYKLLKEAFRGGDTHANMIKCAKIYHDVYSFDASSMYPAMLLLMQFPMTAFEKMPVTSKCLKYIKSKELAWIAQIKLTNVRLKEDQYNPYLSISKCRNLQGVDPDNGRVWKAAELETTVTDIDFSIIEECYDFDSVEIIEDTLYTAHYGYIPDDVRSVIMEYFTAKTKLKIAVKKTAPNSKEREEAEYDLMKAKNKLNGIYGMAATDPIHPIMLYLDNEWQEFSYSMYANDIAYKEKVDASGFSIPDEKSISEQSEKSVLPYVWGVYTTAHARKHLRRILACAESSYIYCDTDSCKATNFNFDKLTELNNWIYELCEETNSFVDIDGKKYYIGYFDCESDVKSENRYEPEYKDFKTLGAKKYCFNAYKETKDKTYFGCTISGVKKSRGVEVIKNLDNFREGFKIKNSGGFQIWYNDSDTITKVKVKDYQGKEAVTEYTGYSCMIPRDYEIGLSDDQIKNYTIIDEIVE